ncbi:MAG TPA: hypothetical protein VLF18_20575 [Tahibacter sp.]|uniref:hypothetical protein n=1 Tax=Tahibacter sp. TaxID=2056211 RepID=UPI002C7C66DF|nr:hypothetical protein [Tahibacter sp.]HSX62585.1 hypothetical protein [Tahibacter sp.]
MDPRRARPHSTNPLPLRLLLAGIAALVAWKAATTAAPGLLPGMTAERALALDPGNTRAALAVARGRASADAQTQAARALLHDALARAPLDGRLLRELAVLAGIETPQGQALLQAALRLRPADVQTRAWLADSALVRDDMAAAAMHVDAILRVAPQRAAQLFPLMQQWLRRDAGLQALVPVFAAAPAWRTGFFAAAPAPPQRETLHAMARLLLALRASAAPADLREGVTVVDRLLHGGEVERAWLLWLALQPPAERSGPLLRNGDFERPGLGSGFDWILRGAGSTASLRRAPQGSQALRVRFDQRPLQGASAAQTLLLAPGGYRLEGRLRLEAIERSDQLEWRVDCIAPQPRALAAAALPATAADWTGFALEFRVPPDCSAQRLQLQARGTALRLAGTAWFDDFDLRAAAPAKAAP